ncbi:MAG TPA: hypothetical protein DCE41_15750 [Cytophagales bacterium]|nr:hypothetical protein [Cytophagales bacterium]HAA23385.1 hypothetical protein [Cytophagales bacterium]HAP58135.1 hypothetical protein [Cytophagales bacterium]
MKTTTFFSTLLFVLVCLGAKAQVDGEECWGRDPKAWNFPEGELNEISREKNAYYSDQSKVGNHEAAAPHLFWLINNVPDLNEGLYINGAKIYQALGDQAEDAAQKEVYYDSVIWCYNRRAEIYCDPDGKLQEWQAYHSFRFFYRNPKRHSSLYSLFRQAREATGDNFKPINAEYFMQVSVWLAKREKISADEFFNVYDEMSTLVSHYRSSGTLSDAKASAMQDKLDGIVTSGPIQVDDEFIATTFCPVLEANPDDVNQAKKIVSFSMGFKAKEHGCFLDAVKIVFEAEPTAALARLLAEEYNDMEQYDEALGYYQQCIDMTEDPIKVSDLYYTMALVQRKRALYSSARSYSLKGLEADPANTKHCLMIGDVYQASFEGCKKGENKVHDRAIFIAAYNWYAKAGDTNRMNIAKQQFPSKEDIFSYNMNVGDSYTVGCWVNETVTIKARD